MRCWRALPLISLLVSSAWAVDWPPAIERYEILAIAHPGSAGPARRLMSYAQENFLGDELAARWQTLAVGPQEARYRLLIGQLLAAEEKPEAARQQFLKATEVAPEDPAAWLALGEFETTQKSPAARAALEKALALGLVAGDPQTAVESLAADHLANGRAAEALETLQNGWMQVTAPATRLRIITKWAEVAFAQNQLNDVRELLERAQTAGRDHGAELAQFYLAIGDYPEADTILTAGRKAHPEDASLRAQAIAVARAARRMSDVERLLAEDTQAAPAPEKWRDLFVVDVENGQADAAREIITRHGEALAATSASWRDLVSRLWQLDLDGPIVSLLVNQPDWEACLTRAEVLLAEGKTADAEPVLWTILDSKWDAQPLSSVVRETNGETSGTAYFRTGLPGVTMDDRYLSGSSLVTSSTSVFNPRRWFRGFGAPKLQTVYEARQAAAIYLAVLANGTDRAEAFVERLKSATASWPLAERALVWSLVENPENLLQTFDEVAALNPPNATLERFFRFRFSSSFKFEAPFFERAKALNSTFNRSAASIPRNAVVAGPSLFAEQGLDETYQAFTTGDYAKARAAFAQALERQKHGTGPQFRAGYPDAFVRYLVSQVFRTQRDPVKLPGAVATVLEFFTSTASHPPLLRSLGQLQLPQNGLSSYLSYSNGSNYDYPAVRPEQLPEKIRQKIVLPPNDLFNQGQTSQLWSLFSMTRDPAVWAKLKAELAAIGASEPLENRRNFQAAAAYFDWWNGDYDDAIRKMQAILAEKSDRDVGLGLVSMLRKLDRSGEANAVLQSMEAPYPAFHRLIDGWRINLAAEAKDTPTAKVLAAGLAGEPLDRASRRRIANALDTAGMKEDAKPFRQSLAEESAEELDQAEMKEAMNDQVAAQDRLGAINLVKKVLSPSPFLAERSEQFGSTYRETPLAVLDQFGERQAFVDTLKTTAASADGDGADAVRIAEAERNKEELVTALRAALHRRPDHSGIAWMLFNRSDSPSPGRRDAFEALLALEPETIMNRSGSQMVSEFEREKELPRLVQALEKAPFRPVRWRNTFSNDAFWTQLITQLKSSNQQDLAVRVELRAVQVLKTVPASLRQSLVRDLLAAGRKDEAGEQLLTALASDSAAPLFALRRESSPRQETASADFEVLKTARDLNILPALEARLNRTGAKSDQGKITQMWLRLLNRETAVLPEVDAYLDGAGKPLTSQRTWIKQLLETTTGWPEAADLTDKALTAYEQSLGRQQINVRLRDLAGIAQLAAQLGNRECAERTIRAVLTGYGEMRQGPDGIPILHATAVAASTCRNMDLLGQCLKTLIERIGRQNEKRERIYNPETAVATLILAADCGRTEEFAQLLKALRNTVGIEHSPSFRDQLRAVEGRGEWLQGDFQKSSPIAWLPAASENGQTVLWDIGAVVRQSVDSGSVIAQADSASPSNRHYTVELFAGDSEGAMESVFRQTDAAVRGSWQGALPSGSDRIRAVFSEGDHWYVGALMPLAQGGNLLASEKAGTWSLSDNLAKQVDGGPVPLGSYFSFGSAASDGLNTNQSNAWLILGRGKVQPNRDYLVSGWLRFAGERGFAIRWTAYNDAQQRCGEGNLTDDSGVVGLWNYVWHRLSTNNRAEGNPLRLPPEAVSVEFSVNASNAPFDLTSLSLVELPESKTTP